MNCKDCHYSGMCKFEAFRMGDCQGFKDKSKFIELPCKVGEACYCVDDNKVKPCIIITYYLDFCGLMCDLKISQNNCNPNALASVNKIIQFTPCDVVFLTEAEAVAKMKEMERE